jgi:hypothetical protein
MYCDGLARLLGSLSRCPDVCGQDRRGSLVGVWERMQSEGSIRKKQSLLC